ncbi:MAG: pre-toxin TG domain-containing protein [Thermoanaerobaculia bacterium]
MSADRHGYTGALRWYFDMRSRASDELFPENATDQANEAYLRKRDEYRQFGQQLVQSPDMRYRSTVDRRTGTSYLYRENPLVPRIMQVIAAELVRWYEQYPVDREFRSRGWFLTWSARAGYGLFLEERSDFRALLRIAQTLPLDTEISQVPVDRPAVVEAVELAIGLVPIVGSVVAAYEAWAGVDLFGYHLTDLERGILAATVLLPIAGRVARGGRAIYTEARMVALYGRDAAAWSRTIRSGSRASAPALRTLEQAEAALRTQRSLDRTLAQRASTALPSVVRGTGPAPAALPQAVTDLFRTLTSRHSILRSLDDLALRRVLEKGPNVDHLKGQLLEEILESRVVPWLRDRAGSFALGVQTGGRQLEFIPGHLIRDVNGRQITDGILAVRNNGVLEIAAVFEAKAGRRAARELSLTSGSISSLSADARAELRAFARDVWREERAEALAAARPFNRTIEQIEREFIQSELGGQVRRDIERLTQMPQIRVAGSLLPVRLSPTRTKFFGVLPRDVNRSLIERELRDSGFSFEIIGADISQRDLRSIAAELVDLARTMATAP